MHIVVDGFRDSEDYYGMENLHSGDWLSDRPLDADEGAVGNPMSTGPFVVNATFAIELYLKTLNRLYGNDIGRTHDLLRLFLALPDEAMQAVRREFSIALPRPASITDIKAFQAEIERVRHSFMEWRYLHERKQTGEVRFPELIFVLNVLHNTCRSDAKLKGSNPAAATGAEPSPR